MGLGRDPGSREAAARGLGEHVPSVTWLPPAPTFPSLPVSLTAASAPLHNYLLALLILPRDCLIKIVNPTSSAGSLGFTDGLLFQPLPHSL